MKARYLTRFRDRQSIEKNAAASFPTRGSGGNNRGNENNLRVERSYNFARQI
jgi:hypothetical protein